MLFSKDLVNILGEVILVISECLHRFYLKVARIPYKTIVTLNIAFYNYKKNATSTLKLQSNSNWLIEKSLYQSTGNDHKLKK